MSRLIDRLARNPLQILWVFALYFLVQIAVRLLLPHGLRIDEAQQVLLSQWFVAGYDAQPPLYNWLQQATFAVTGDYLLGLAVLKSAVLFAVVASYYALARLLVRQPAFAAVAMFGFFFIPQMFWQAQRDLTHTTATMLMVNLILIAAVLTLRSATLRNYLLLGCAAGLGMLTKYNFALVLPSLAMACLLHPGGFRRICDPRILVTMLVAGLIVLPHALWFVDNLGLASSVTAARMAEDAADTSRLLQILLGLGELLQMTIVIASPVVLVLVLAAGLSVLSAWRSRSVESRFVGVFLIAILTILTLMIVVLTFTTFRDRWLLPLLQVLPIYFVLKMDAHGIDAEASLRRLLPTALIVMVVIPVAMLVAGRSGSPSHYQQPYAAFREVMTQNEATTPSVIVTTDWLSGGNLRMQWPDAPVMVTQFPNLTIPFDWTPDRPVALIWRGDSATLPPQLERWAKENLGTETQRGETKSLKLPFSGTEDNFASPFHYMLVSR